MALGILSLWPAEMCVLMGLLWRTLLMQVAIVLALYSYCSWG